MDAKSGGNFGYDISAENLKRLAEELILLLRIRSIPIGMKLFENVDEMQAIPGLRTPTPEFNFTMCQLVGQVRTAGFTLGIVHENTRMNSYLLYFFHKGHSQFFCYSSNHALQPHPFSFVRNKIGKL